MRFLVVESETDEERDARRESAGKSSGETFAATLDQLAPGCDVTLVTPSDGAHELMAADEIAGHASRLDTLGEENRHQGRSLDQVRADVTRIERQASVDVAELRATDTALARVVLKADGTRSRTAS